MTPNPGSGGPPSSMPPRGASRAVGKRPRMSRFLKVLVAVTVGTHLPFVAAVYEACRRLGIGSPALIAWLAGLLGSLLFVGRARAGAADAPRGRFVPTFVDIPYFVHWCACVFTLVPSALSLVVYPLVCFATRKPIGLPFGFYLWTYVAGLVVCGYGILVRRRWFTIEHVDVKVRGLDPALDGYRIAHLSDLHIGTLTTRAFAERWTRAANGQAPDIAVVTGDMVTSGTAYHRDIADAVATLRARDGVYVSMGNHDYFGEGEPLITLLRERGVVVLRNEGVTLARGPGRLYLAGIDDTWTKRDDLTKALRERPPQTPTVLLAHDPERFRQAAAAGVELTLSGHTHGGQIAFPFLAKQISLSHLAHHFHLGIYRDGDSTLYVHPGLGTTGPPMRLGVAPAVVILHLHPA